MKISYQTRWSAVIVAGLLAVFSGTAPASSGAAPVITSVAPNPLSVGTINVTLTGTGFQQGALVYESYGSQSMIQYSASSVTATAVTVNGLYQGAGTTATFYVRNPNGVLSAGVQVPIGGSAGSETGAGSSPSSAPVITAVNPSPLPVGTINVTLTGTGFQKGTLVYESYGSQNMIQYSASSVTANTITVNGLYQGAGTTATFYVRNPDGTYSAAMMVPIVASSGGGSPSGGGSSSAPVITTLTPNPLPVGTQNITIAGSGFQQGALVYQSYGSQSMIQYSSSSVTSGAVTVNGIYQGAAQTAVFCVKNPGTACSNSITVTINNGPPGAPTIIPATVNVNLGATQLFTTSGATSLTATAGTITAGGFYTAPAAMPATSTVTITAAGPGGSTTATVTLINPNPQVVVPATVTLPLGATQQFASQGATSWSAAVGTITGAGFYTAPAVYPAAGQDIITVVGPNGTGNATVTLTPPTPVITGVGASNQLPLGIFSAVVTGSGFTAQSTATLGGAAITATYAGGGMTISGFYGQNGAVPLVISNPAVASQPFNVQVGIQNAAVSPAAAARFLEQAGFGPSPADSAHLQAIGFQAWLNEQFAMAPVSNYSAVGGASGMREVFLANAVTNPDQLRQKVAFALSQIFVTSLLKVPGSSDMIPYQQMLLGDAFTNYLQILTDVTLSPAMGYYLDMANNAKADPVAGTAANENYAREIMQLMSIGTKVLNPDGTFPVDANGFPIPTYQQSDVSAMARIFTGWTWAPNTPGGSPGWGGFINPNAPMAPYPPEHDNTAKTVMTYTAQQGLSPQADLTGVLQYLANHPNTAPFISKQLIQHLVKSNPSPAYVQRVSTAFTNSNGDMPTVISAILLDAEARANDQGGNDQPTDGHLQEPALLMAGVVRAFSGQMTPANFYGSVLAALGQDIFNAGSVFNYYSPSYVVAGTGGLLGPEFQIDNPNATLLRENFVASLTNSFANPVLSNGPGTTVDVTPFLALANQPAALANAVNLALTGGVLPQGLMTLVQNAVAADGAGALHRVETAMYLILTSGYYNVWH